MRLKLSVLIKTHSVHSAILSASDMVLAFNLSANISSMRIASVKKLRESGMLLSPLTATISIAQLAIKR